MLRCREVARRVASGELADAGWAQRLSVRFHLFMCRDCTRYAAQLDGIGAAARASLQAGEPSPAVLRRLERDILGSGSGAPESYDA